MDEGRFTAPFQRDRLRSIEDGNERNAAKGGEMLDQRPHQRFDALVGRERISGKGVIRIFGTRN